MKQAVVLIHGVGEQKPMDTVRGFVESIVPPATGGQEPYWSSPDPMSQSFELRRLQTLGRDSTHFFEYYWAHHMEGTTLAHLGQWLGDLLWRRPSSVPPGLCTVWYLSWGLALSVLVLAAGGWLVSWNGGDTSPLAPTALALGAVLAVLQGILLHYAGDAARYLSKSPQNVAVRHRIRSEGIALLRKIHESGKYDRVVIVGHSLGSVIGYDILNALWAECNTVHGFASKASELDTLLAANRRPQPVLRVALVRVGEALRSVSDTGGPAAVRDGLRRMFRHAQLAAWKEQRYWGSTWRVTDFVTLGSPLAHAVMLMARSPAEFDARRRQRELPTCPPVLDDKHYGYALDALDTPAKRKFTPLVLHHAAWSGVTRWTNLYFPARCGLFGDLIAGPLETQFGAGIQDVAVRSDAWTRHTPAAHTTYWDRASDAPARPGPHIYALPALKAALALERRDYALPSAYPVDALRALLKPHVLAMDALAAAPQTHAQALAQQLVPGFWYFRDASPAFFVEGTAAAQSVLADHELVRHPHKIDVIPLEGSVLVSSETRSSDGATTRRHLRVFVEEGGKWRLVGWYCKG